MKIISDSPQMLQGNMHCRTVMFKNTSLEEVENEERKT
jgi:hypothetical protein